MLLATLTALMRMGWMLRIVILALGQCSRHPHLDCLLPTLMELHKWHMAV